jgi:hypothetical protein
MPAPLPRADAPSAATTRDSTITMIDGDRSADLAGTVIRVELHDRYAERLG